MKIPIVTNLFHYFHVFYGYAGRRLFLLCLIIFLGVLSDGFGISMLLPLFNIDKSETSLDSYTRFIYRFIENIGLPASLYTILFFMISAFLLKGAFTFMHSAVYGSIRSNLVKELRLSMANKYSNMNYTYYTNANIGFLNNIITTEIDRAVGGFSKYVDVLVNGIYIVIYLCIAFSYDWKITILTLGLCSILFILFRTFASTIKKLSVNVSEKNASIQAILIQIIYNFKYLKSTDSFAQLSKQLSKQIGNLRNLIFRSEIINAVPGSILEPITVICLSGLIIVQVGFFDNNIAGSMILLVFFYKSFSRVFGFQHVWQQFCSFVGGVEVVEKASRELVANKECSGSLKLDGINKDIVLQNVNFSYGDRQVLFDINVVIPKNKTIGIVGESGAGKTTLFDTIAGLIKPQSGRVCIDGINYNELEITSLRRMIGYVTQEPVIFNDTIANNISFWKGDYKEAICRKMIENAAELANCVPFINETENGYNTVIGDKGIKLSSGQRQRIAIARELFKDPQILIFDEATSSLDTESEIFIQDSIKSMMGKRTMIIIAHRLSTIRNCDYIYVLNRGRIVEQDSYDGLYGDESSRFSRMCRIQNL